MQRFKSRAEEWAVVLSLIALVIIFEGGIMVESSSCSPPRRMLVDTDVDTDDFFALLYLLKLNRSQLDLTAVTINANAWTDAGHGVNHIYDLLFMMGRDDISVGIGGEGGILEDGTILPNVGGYLPIIEQGTTTTGYCRYRQSIPVGKGGRLDIDTNYGLRKEFLPQGSRHYIPLRQPTAQQVMIDTISKGPTTVLLLGAHTNFAIFLMNNPHLKKNVEHIYAMGGSINRVSSEGHVGNIFTTYTSNPYAEFNLFQDPFAAHQVIHSGIPVTLVPIDATDTIPITEYFLRELERTQSTYEAQYIYRSLKLTHDTWFDDQFFQRFFMWDCFTAGIAASVTLPNGDNQFSLMEYMNITVVTSNEPYGVSDGSNPFFDDRKLPKFGLKKGSAFSGHVQMGLQDPFCLVENGDGRCQDARTRSTTEPGAARVLVARKAKAAKDPNSLIETEFAKTFLDAINRPHQSGRFNYTSQFSDSKQAFHVPAFGSKILGKPVIFDMDMSVGDFIALFYLLKVPRDVINLEAILITPTGWASAATIDIVYDVLHMMGRDDIPVGLGNFFALNQSYPSTIVGDCKYAKAIPHGSGGLLDSDTLYGLARSLPRSPRRYTAEDSVKYGAPRDTEHPELRQPLALEVWENVTIKHPKTKITILTNGPLTTLASIITSDKNATSHIQEVFVVGGHIRSNANDAAGNVFTIPSNRYAEFNMFLDPMAANTVLNADVDITLIPLGVQRKINSLNKMLRKLKQTRKTPEVIFVKRLVYQLQHLKKQHFRYRHMGVFMGEILGAPILMKDLKSTFVTKPIRVRATGNESTDGQLEIDPQNGKRVRVLHGIDPTAYYDLFAARLGDNNQCAVEQPIFPQSIANRLG